MREYKDGDEVYLEEIHKLVNYRSPNTGVCYNTELLFAIDMAIRDARSMRRAQEGAIRYYLAALEEYHGRAALYYACPPPRPPMDILNKPSKPAPIPSLSLYVRKILRRQGLLSKAAEFYLEDNPPDE